MLKQKNYNLFLPLVPHVPVAVVAAIAKQCTANAAALRRPQSSDILAFCQNA